MDGGDQQGDQGRGERTVVPTLVSAQALGLSGGPLVFMVAGIVGTDLAPTAELASLPLATMVVGTALASAPAALGMRRLGRRVGFASGAAVGTTGALLASAAMVLGSLIALALATMAIGASLAFVMQYRFAAAELVPPGRRERAVASVMSGGIVAGVLGPELGMVGRHLLTTPWAGSFLVLAGVYAALAILLLTGLPGTEPPPQPSTPVVRDPARAEARGASAVALPVAGAVTAYAVMTLLMTSTPFAMRGAGFAPDQIALVIQAHVVAMYAPSVVSGRLVARSGARRLMAGGLGAMGACLLVGVSTEGLGSWVAGLVLLGLGWNALFLGATIALSESVEGEARFRALALNESLVFGAQALASLAAGPLIAVAGWPAVTTAALGLLGLMTLMLAVTGGPLPEAALRTP